MRFQAYSVFLVDLLQPSEAHLNAVKNAPLMEPSPLQFWKVVSGVLFIANLILLALILY